jgi:hypothetical protein
VTVTKWLQVDYIEADGWVLPIWAALNRAAAQGRVRPLPYELGQLGLHVSTRLTMIETLIRRINIAARRLEDLIKGRQPHHEFTAPDNAYAFRLPSEFKYSFLVDLDALLFEVKSSCELMERLFENVYAHAGKALPLTPAGRTIRQVLQDAGQDAAWFPKLADHRNFFIHEGAPYFAVDLSSAQSGAYDLLIMTSNLRSFDDENQFLRYSDLQRIVGGFQASKPAVQQHLAQLFARTEVAP